MLVHSLPMARRDGCNDSIEIMRLGHELGVVVTVELSPSVGRSGEVVEDLSEAIPGSSGISRLPTLAHPIHNRSQLPLLGGLDGSGENLTFERSWKVWSGITGAAAVGRLETGVEGYCIHPV
uniref:Uncharacterized protein n=1 Tax=Spongospora subterranea TaxID=70186 RepID=A0A0H5RV76_9EUKA|eukprot:CRZ12654.1 hypothetical protein [Spongospora subterranea]